MKILVKLQTPLPPSLYTTPTLITFLEYLSHSTVLVWHIGVGPAVYVRTRRRLRRCAVAIARRRVGDRQLARTVAGAQGSLVHQFGGNGLQVVGPTDQRERVDEQGGQVQLVVEQFGVLVVPGERMVIVVPAVAARGHRHEHVLGGVDVPGGQKARKPHFKNKATSL